MPKGVWVQVPSWAPFKDLKNSFQDFEKSFFYFFILQKMIEFYFFWSIGIFNPACEHSINISSLLSRVSSLFALISHQIESLFDDGERLWKNFHAAPFSLIVSSYSCKIWTFLCWDEYQCSSDLLWKTCIPAGLIFQSLISSSTFFTFTALQTLLVFLGVKRIL